MRMTRIKMLRGAAIVGALALALTACSSGSDSSSNATSGSDGASGELKGTLTVWAWEPTLTQVVKDFEAANPGVTVKLVNAGTGNAQYTALQNAIAAGSGVPDVAQIEYFAIPQFAIGDSLTDLSSMGAGDLDGTFTPGPWSSVNLDGAVYGLPMDSGPMAMFYNKEVFDKVGVAVPTTWDEYLDAARKIHAADPKAYIASDTGDAGFITSMIWQAGGRPFKVDGTNVTIDFSDPGTAKFLEVWQKMIDEKLLSPITGWSNEWYQGLANGTLATLTLGAWMPANLESGVPSGAGKWRVADMPQWAAGENVTSESGGSSLAIPKASANQNLAYAFAKYANAGPGVKTRVDGGAFPATTAELASAEFLAKESPYFGGQKINEVLAKAAGDVGKGWQYLPYQVYANSIFGDTAGQAYISSTTLSDGLAAWQKSLIQYGNDQGFTVK